MEKQKRLGLCIFCKKPKLQYTHLCENHYFKSIARSALHNIKMASQLKDMFYLQNEKCYLTGNKLYLGLNASIDHIKPRSKHKGEVSDIHNIKWCDKRINFMKRDMELKEFIDTCKLISSRFI